MQTFINKLLIALTLAVASTVQAACPICYPCPVCNPNEVPLTSVGIHFYDAATFPFQFSMTIDGQGFSRQVNEVGPDNNGVLDHFIPAYGDPGTAALSNALTDGKQDTVQFTYGDYTGSITESEMRVVGNATLSTGDYYPFNPGEVDYSPFRLNHYSYRMFDPRYLSVTIWGWPIPEPSTLALALIGAFVVLIIWASYSRSLANV
jgi:hypothetical protein